MDINIEERKWLVYMHINKTNGKKYVGICCRSDVTKRWGSNGGGYSYNKHFSNAIKKYGWKEGFEHEIIATDLSWEEATKLEIKLIAELDLEDPNKGYNNSSGGEGYPGIFTSAAKRAVELCSYKVYQYDKDGNFLASFDSINEAERQTGVFAPAILKCWHGEYRQAKGFYWSPEKLDHYIPPEKVHHKAKPYYQFSLDGTFIRSFTSSREASEATGCTVQEIQVSAKEQERGMARHGGGFLWTHGNQPKLLKHEPRSADPKSVRCIELDRVFSSMGEAAEQIQSSRATLRRHIKSGTPLNGYHYEYVTTSA